jgi:hypothetical protein
MRKSLSLFTMGLAVTVSTGYATYWSATNEDTAAIGEIWGCILAAMVVLALQR